jgi:hypothetical protein
VDSPPYNSEDDNEEEEDDVPNQLDDFDDDLRGNGAWGNIMEEPGDV